MTQALEDRVRRLERFNKLLLAAAASIAVVGALAAFQSSTQEVYDARFRIVRAAKFEVVDSRTGKPRVSLDHMDHEQGWAGVTLWDQKGIPRAILKHQEGGRTWLSMLDAAGTTRTELELDEKGKSHLFVDRCATPPPVPVEPK